MLHVPSLKDKLQICSDLHLKILGVLADQYEDEKELFPASASLSTLPVMPHVALWEEHYSQL